MVSDFIVHVDESDLNMKCCNTPPGSRLLWILGGVVHPLPCVEPSAGATGF